MRALTRPPEGPRCLDGFDPKEHAWNDLTGEDRAEIWGHLMPMQQGLCAYCEGGLSTDAPGDQGRHIEHTRRRSTHPGETFAWSNLLGSCDCKDSCGHFKDGHHAPAYEDGDLIDPTQEDPDALLIIRDSGRMEARPGLSRREQERAALTLRVLNLNMDITASGRPGTGWKVAARRRVLQVYLEREPDILGFLAELPDEVRQQLVDEELRQTAGQPFSSILRHFLNG